MRSRSSLLKALTLVCLQVEEPTLQEALSRAASQLYTALSERMAGTDADSEVVRLGSVIFRCIPLRSLAGRCTDKRCWLMITMLRKSNVNQV